MAWYEAHQTMAKHPKTLKLASLTNCERRYCVGLLHDLFTWGLDIAKPDGTLPNIGPREIASALELRGKKGAKIVTALVESGYIECENGVYKIHDWYDYAGKLMDRREEDKKRKQRRKEARFPEEIQRKASGNPYATVPNSTVPNIKGGVVGITRAREETAEEPTNDLGKVMNLFLNRINSTPSSMCCDFLKSYTESLGGDVVLHAIQIAIDERKTNWSYIHGILQRYERDGLRTLDAVLQAEADFASRKQAQPRAGSKERRVMTFMDIAEGNNGH